MTLQKKATLVASFMASVLAVLKLVTGLISGSVSVLASAIDSLLDLLISLFNFFAVSKAEQPADDRFNYGKGKIEALASVIEGTIITLSGLYILYASIDKLITGESTGYLEVAIWVMLASIVLTGGLVVYLRYVSKLTHSLVIKADSLHYQTDLYSNAIVLISLVIIHFSGLSWVDGATGIAIALYIIYAAYELIHEGVLILLDVSLDEETVEKIKQVIKSEAEVTGYHELKTRTSGGIYFVEVHIVFTPHMLLVDAHHIGDEIENSITRLDPKTKWNINLHLDPFDDSMSDKA